MRIFRDFLNGFNSQGIVDPVGYHFQFWSLFAPHGRSSRISLFSESGKQGRLSIKSAPKYSSPYDLELSIIIIGEDLKNARSLLDYTDAINIPPIVTDGWRLSFKGYHNNKYYSFRFCPSKVVGHEVALLRDRFSITLETLIDSRLPTLNGPN